MTDLEQAKHVRERDALAFVLVRDGEVLGSGANNGVGELLTAVDRLGPAARGASLADKVVGKAAAVIAVQAGIRAIDTVLASAAAVDVCARHGIPLHAATTVPLILNRRGDGPCPLEQLTLPCPDPTDSVARLREFLTARRATR